MIDAQQASKEQVADLLDKTADWFDTHKWMRGDFFTKDRSAACAYGAMKIVGGVDKARAGDPEWSIRNEVVWEGREAFEKCLRKDYGPTAIGVYTWNDEQAKDKRTVQRALRRCARRLRGGKS